MQRFVYKGMAPVTKDNQGVVWPMRHAETKSAKSRLAKSKARLNMRKLARNRTVLVGASVLGLLVMLGITQALLDRTADAQSKAAVQAPRFEVDPLWPKPLPNHWVLGQTIGVWVDADDHVWIVHRSSGDARRSGKGHREEDRASCAARARRRSSNSIRPATCCATGAARSQGYEWPDGNHGIFIDHKGNVWIGGNGGPDSTS